MKKILITGANSYVGTNVEKWLLKDKGKYEIDTLDMQDDNWVNHDFSKYDVVYHVAGIAHLKEKRKNKQLYFDVNRDLAFEVAKKSKESGVSQFIFMSSMSVYGLLEGIITTETKPKPNTYYGISKYEAEILINTLESEKFDIVILRPPMIYGEESPGNFAKLEKLSKYLRFVPKIDNKRSVLEVNILSVEIKNIIDKEKKGVFFPQNEEYLVTNKVIRDLRASRDKKTNNCFLLTVGVKMLRPFSKTIKKIYGDLIYK